MIVKDLRLAVAVSKELKDKAERVAHENGLSVSNYIRTLVEKDVAKEIRKMEASK
jgi:antitoxin component of RelBE/YafQ-DinJ toxin-antitoxin module